MQIDVNYYGKSFKEQAVKLSAISQAAVNYMALFAFLWSKKARAQERLVTPQLSISGGFRVSFTPSFSIQQTQNTTTRGQAYNTSPGASIILRTAGAVYLSELCC